MPKTFAEKMKDILFEPEEIDTQEEVAKIIIDSYEKLMKKNDIDWWDYGIDDYLADIEFVVNEIKKERSARK